MGEQPPRVMVRPCRRQDVAALERHLPTGRNRYHAARYDRQRQGVSTFLVAFLGDAAVGCGEVMWEGAKEPEVRARFPGCPEINGLAVAPGRRSQGVGTHIIRAAEHLAVRRGCHRIGLGVDDDNVRAAALYTRLGYRDTGCRYLDRYQYIDDGGVPREATDPCRFLIKTVPAPHFAATLYQGTAESYDRFRPGYPAVLVQDLIGRVRPSRHGRLLDLACGTGQLAFALAGSFAVTWAVDQEPDMVRVVEAKAARSRYAINGIPSSVEELSAPSAGFELITIGNAFHRLHRDPVARRAMRWLRPGGHLALCWANSPWDGDADWQRALGAVLDRWRTRLNSRDRLPPDWAAARRARPDHAVLADAGFEPLGRHEFPTDHRWTVAELAGYTYSTSFLAAPVVGERTAEFEADLARDLEPHVHEGALVDRLGFAYELFGKPAN